MIDRSGTRWSFAGEICGFGTTNGHRVVVGNWHGSPLGSFADVMHESPDGVRTLLAPNERVATFVEETYVFDVVRLVDVTVERGHDHLRVRAGPVRADVLIGRRTTMGRLLAAIPNRLATSPAWCRLVDPIARATMPGVRTRGRAGGHRVESYGATDVRRITSVECTIDGLDAGSLADVDPPVRFGFSSTPRTPSIVQIVTTVDEPAGTVRTGR